MCAICGQSIDVGRPGWRLIASARVRAHTECLHRDVQAREGWEPQDHEAS
jgi:hypothetical protein